MRRWHIALIVLLLSSGLIFSAQVTVFSENFEGALTGWSFTGDWQVGIPTYVGPTTAYQGSRCVATNISGYYSNLSNSILQTPPIQLPATGSQITLSFFEWVSLESCCDFTYLELSANGGLSWNSLRSSYTGTYAYWAQRTFDLTSYKGSNVQLRFRLSSDASNTYPGWYIDSLTIGATVIDTANLPHIAVAPGSFRIGPSDPAVKTMTICNTGIRDTLQYSFNTAGYGAVNIVAWTYGTDLSYEYPNVVASIRSRIPTANFTATTTTDPNTLGLLLQNANVFLIPAQEIISPSYTYGLAFASVLNNFVNSGGIVIALGPSTMSSFLIYAGLDTISTYSSTSSGTVSIIKPTDPVFDSVVAGSLMMLSTTFYWSTMSSASVLATYASYTVCSERKKGSGYIYLLGYDFYSSANTTTWGRMLVNCIVKNISTTSGLITADTASGWLKAGACRNVTLAFHREKMAPGTQIVQLRIQHNAALDPNPISVPCTLLVDSTTMSYAAPSMAVPLFTGDTAVKNVTLQNTGSSILNFSIVKTSKGVPSVLINEVGIYYRFIELLNVGSSDVNIGGWRLTWTDSYGSPGSFTFPANTTIRSHRFVIAYASTGTSNDSLFYIGSMITWTYTSELSVSLINSSGQGVDFFKTSLDATAPPAGTTWLGSGFVRSGSVYDYYRTTTVDNNSAADWASSASSGGYTWFGLNPGQSFTSGNPTVGYISASADSLFVNAGQSSTIHFKYDATALVTSGVYIDTFQIIHNAKNVASPITVICTLVVTSNIPVLIPYQPDPTINRRPVLVWHRVPSGSAYIIEISQVSSFSNLQIIQQTADTFFQPLVPLPLGDIYWRVRCNLNATPSQPDHFFIQSDSIPVLIPIKPDTIPPQAGMMFTWHPGVGATSYKIQIYKIDTLPQAVVITFTNDTFYADAVPLQAGRYMWTVSANFDFSRIAYPDTFWVKSVTGKIPEIKGNVPMVYSLKAFSVAGHLKILCAIPKPVAQAPRTVIEMFDVRGRLISKVFDGVLLAGYYQFRVDVDNIACGVYFCTLCAGGKREMTSFYFKK
jgi:hypothetical protein